MLTVLTVLARVPTYRGMLDSVGPLHYQSVIPRSATCSSSCAADFTTGASLTCHQRWTRDVKARDRDAHLRRPRRD